VGDDHNCQLIIWGVCVRLARIARTIVLSVHCVKELSDRGVELTD
jgi:hypothetical protein